jgi:hypothetical protein
VDESSMVFQGDASRNRRSSASVGINAARVGLRRVSDIGIRRPKDGHLAGVLDEAKNPVTISKITVWDDSCFLARTFLNEGA